MNIQEAKMEVIHTVRAYTAKDEQGEYKIPQIRQRPVLLMGPPGIGKTAIVEQAAKTCGVGLVSYTITHHTRQSAVGLPLVEKKIYDGREVTVTEYTMSEIIASVYECMKNTGCREGILFIDEVNCVSETLAPTMLQFLQGKTFGNHRVPRGWVIVAAGNPSEYNKSVREFDIVTLDRVKKIEVDVDYPAWKVYAAEKEIHWAIRSYLEGKPQYFYRIEQNPDGKEFVTARGWEDLSVILKQYEDMDVAVSEGLILQYLQCREIAEDFVSYYKFYQKCCETYRKEIENVLMGEIENSVQNSDGEEEMPMTDWPLDEQLTVSGLLISQVLAHVSHWKASVVQMRRMEEVWQLLERQLHGDEKNIFEAVQDFFGKRTFALEVKERMETIGEAEARLERQVDRELKKITAELRENGCRSLQEVKQCFAETMQNKKMELEREARTRAEEMNRALGWIAEKFGTGTPFLTAMETVTVHEGCMELIQEQSCPVYEENCGILMMRDREKRLREKIQRMQETGLFVT
ncbi:MAG: ATP-binding protein [Oliverpabstia sp.]